MTFELKVILVILWESLKNEIESSLDKKKCWIRGVDNGSQQHRKCRAVITN